MKTHLQGIGEREAIKAVDLRPGMVTIWNYGCIEIIKDITVTKSGKSIKCTVISEYGKEFTRTMRINRLVVVEN